MYDFESQVEVDLYHTQYKGAWDVQPIKIKWSAELELRSWGIKDISVFVPDQEVTLIFTIANPKTGDEEERQIQFPLTNIKASFGYDFTTQINPTQLTIHDNESEVEFY